MNLVNPAALVLAVLAVPIVIFYILKVRLRRVPVSTLIFWEQIFEEKKRRSLWQRLRHLLSLLLQLLFLALLVSALADPIFRWQQARARRVVLVVDNSSSMNAADVARTRLAAAKTAGLKVIEGMRLGDELAIIAAGSLPRVVCGPTDHERTLREALDSIVAVEGPTRVADAVALARRLLSGSDKLKKVVVLSDGAFDGAGELARQENVEWIGVGKPTGNVGITRLQARRSLLDPIGYEILAEVANASDEPLAVRLELDLGDDPIDVVPLNLAPGEKKVQVFEKTSADGGRLRATIDRADRFVADNTAWAILPRREHQRVSLVTPGDLFLEKVFEAIPLVDLAVVKVAPNAGAPVGASGAPNSVFHRKFPDVLPAGNVLVIDPDRSGPLWQVGEAIHNPIVAKQDKDSPLMRNIRLDNVVMPEAKKLTFQAPAHVLAESAGGDPLYAILDRPDRAGGKVVVLTLDLDKSDLPLQTAFPIMMSNLLNWFGGTKGELREALAAGSAAEIDLPAQSNEGYVVTLKSPDGRERTIDRPSAANKVTVGPLDRTGVWSVIRKPVAPGKGEGEVLAELACNLSDRRESDIRPAAGLPEQTLAVASALAIRPIWYYLLVSALTLTCWEWFLYQRRWIE